MATCPRARLGAPSPRPPRSHPAPPCSAGPRAAHLQATAAPVRCWELRAPASCRPVRGDASCQVLLPPRAKTRYCACAWELAFMHLSPPSACRKHPNMSVLCAASALRISRGVCRPGVVRAARGAARGGKPHCGGWRGPWSEARRACRPADGDAGLRNGLHQCETPVCAPARVRWAAGRSLPPAGACLARGVCAETKEKVMRRCLARNESGVLKPRVRLHWFETASLHPLLRSS